MTNRNSAQIANLVATPKVKNDSHINGVVHWAAGYVANAADDASASIFRFCRVPSSARVRSVQLTTGDASSAGAVDIGIYQTAENGGAVVDADLFAAALALTGGPFVNSEQIAASGELTVAERIMPLWQVLGLTADPNIEYDVAATITTTFNGAAVGQLLEVNYVV